MKKHILLLFILCAWAWGSHCQNVVYSISATRDGSPASLDSILFENLDNQTRLLMGNLPALEVYEIDITSQQLVTGTGHLLFLQPDAFRLIKNIPGEAGVLLPAQMDGSTLLKIYSLGGQEVFSRLIPPSGRQDIVTVTLPHAGIYILNLSNAGGGVNYKVFGAATPRTGMYGISTSREQTFSRATEPFLIRTQLKSATSDNDFSYQAGDSLRVTAFLDGYYTYPVGIRVHGSEAIGFTMLESTSESTGISDMYRPLAEGDYSVLAYDAHTGGTRIALLSDEINLFPGDILTLDLDSIGLIQKVVKVSEENGNTLVDNGPGFMDELFVNASFTLDTRLIEPKTFLNEDAPAGEVIRALTDQNGRIHPVRVVFHDGSGIRHTQNVLEGNVRKNLEALAIGFQQDLSGTDLHGQPGQPIHFYIDQGHVSLSAEALFEFEFTHEGELTEDSKVKKGDLSFFRYSLEADAGFQNRLVLDLENGGEESGNKKVFSPGKTTAMFLVPPDIPVWVTLESDVFSDYHILSQEPIHARWGFEGQHEIQAGGVYEKEADEFTATGEASGEKSVHPLLTEGGANMSARVEIYPRTAIWFYGFFGPNTEIVSSVAAGQVAGTYQLHTPSGKESFLAWTATLDHTLELRTGASLRFLQHETDYGPFTTNDQDPLLWSSPAGLELLTSLPREVTPGQELELQLKVTDDAGNPAPMAAVIMEGEGRFSLYAPVADANGMVFTNWTPDPLEGDKSFTATVLRADSSVVRSVSGTVSVAGEPAGTFTDPRDDKTYNWVRIGAQVWMAENLKYLPSVVDRRTGSDTTAYYYVYDYNMTDIWEAMSTPNYKGYGVLYNWPAAMDGAAATNANPSGVQGACPPGWHLPSDAEWEQLFNFLIDHFDDITQDNVANKLKSCLQVGSPLGGLCATTEHPRWDDHYPAHGTDDFGFSALPGGARLDYGTTGSFNYLGWYGNWWSTHEYFLEETKAASRHFSYDHGKAIRQFPMKPVGLSVRCVQD
jgi:uncharacterized protein (TIGR02145 family)